MTEEKALAIPAQAQHLMPALSVQQATQRYQAMTKFIQDIMSDGIDFGTIPGTNKPTLLKPGAEKLTTFFGLTVRFQTVEKIEDWGGAKFGGEPFFYYWFRCQLWRGEMMIAEADGSCNSRESKYRWRWVSEDDLPAGINKAALKTRRGSLVEFTFAVDKAETSGKYGKPPEYWQQFKDAVENGTAKKTTRETRSGKQYDAWEIDTTVYRVPNEDVFSQVNTVQKMAQKRALVAATLLAVNASEFFTQDLEDLDVDGYVDANYTVISTDGNGSGNGSEDEQPSPPPRKPKAANPQKPANGKKANGLGGYSATDQKKAIENLLEKVNDATGGHYKNTVHLLNALRGEFGDDFHYPHPHDDDAWAPLMAFLIERVSESAGQSELDLG